MYYLIVSIVCHWYYSYSSTYPICVILIVLYILLLLIFHLRPDVPPVLTYFVSCIRVRVWVHVLIIFLRARIRSLCAYTCKECAYFDILLSLEVCGYDCIETGMVWYGMVLFVISYYMFHHYEYRYDSLCICS